MSGIKSDLAALAGHECAHAAVGLAMGATCATIVEKGHVWYTEDNADSMHSARPVLAKLAAGPVFEAIHAKHGDITREDLVRGAFNILTPRNVTRSHRGGLDQGLIKEILWTRRNHTEPLPPVEEIMDHVAGPVIDLYNRCTEAGCRAIARVVEKGETVEFASLDEVFAVVAGDRAPRSQQPPVKADPERFYKALNNAKRVQLLGSGRVMEPAFDGAKSRRALDDYIRDKTASGAVPTFDAYGRPTTRH